MTPFNRFKLWLAKKLRVWASKLEEDLFVLAVGEEPKKILEIVEDRYPISVKITHEEAMRKLRDLGILENQAQEKK